MPGDSNIFDMLAPRHPARARALWGERLRSTEPMPAEDYWVRPGGGPWLCLSVLTDNCLEHPVVDGIVVTARDVTEQRYYGMRSLAVSAASKVLAHAMTESELIQQTCNLIVSDINSFWAWVGLRDPSRPFGLRIVAAGDGSTGFVEAIEELVGCDTWLDPLTSALETDEPQIVHDVEALSERVAWRQLTLDYGYRSMLVFPPRFGDGGSGVLASYAENPNMFDPDRIGVVGELARDLSYGVEALRTGAHQSAYQARLEASLTSDVRAIEKAVELRDPYIAGYQSRVAE